RASVEGFRKGVHGVRLPGPGHGDLMLRLADDWIWDSWIADDGDLYHLYFLRAPRSLVDPGRRHARATIGHASSSDLVEWTYHGEAVRPDPTGWDDLALWTGSVVRDDRGVW